MTLSPDFKSRIDRNVRSMPDETIILLVSCCRRMANERPDLQTVAYALAQVTKEAEKRGLEGWQK